MHAYRSHTCGQLRLDHSGQDTRISGWVHRVRDHGGVLFIDLRDHYGMTQVVADPDSPAFKTAENFVPNGWCGSMARCGRDPREPRTRICRPASSRYSRRKSKSFRKPPSCRCRCSAIRSTQRTFASSTAFSISAATAFTATSCNAARSSTRSAAA
ncbi:MAG: hypothetical protein HC855_08235 [Rhizobiales bacterium]|nr:hypothetical protein [Hyphomicrobiales bacterium]